MLQWEYCYVYSNPTTVVYGIYRTDDIYTAEKQPFSTESLGYCLANLGLLGWEAISVTNTSEEMTWYFKRAIHPNNQPLTFP